MFWKRVKQQEAEPAEPDEAEIAAARVATRRLGRLVERQRDGDAGEESDSTAIAARLLGAFGDNAFLALGVPMDAGQAAIAAAVDDLAFAEDVDSSALEEARMALLAPRERLVHELAWLPGCAPAIENDVRAALRAGDREAIDRLRFAATGLARVNLAAALLQADENDDGALATLLDELRRCDLAAARDRIDEARGRAGFRPVDPEHFDEAARTHCDRIAALAARSALATRSGRQALGHAIEANREALITARARMLEQVANRYARAADGQLQTLRGQIDEGMAALKANPRNPARLTAMITALDVWSQLRLPIQQMEQVRGLDDLVSESLFGALREFGISLANEHRLDAEVLRLAKAMRHAFGQVPGLKDRLERDIATLTGNVLFNRFDMLIGRIAADSRQFRVEVHRFGFGAGRGVEVARVADTFLQCHELDPEEGNAFIMLRNLAIRIANDQLDRDCALVLVGWMIDQHPPARVEHQLVQDFCQLQPRKD